MSIKFGVCVHRCTFWLQTKSPCFLDASKFWDFKKIFSHESVITITYNAQICETIELLDPRYQIFIIDSHHLSIKYDPHKISVAEIISKLNQTYQITDLSISHPDIEDMVRTIFQTQKQENV